MHDPTTLPEAGSVSKLSHNYSVFQTRVLQKLGKLEKSLEYTPEFRTLNDRAKEFVICYEEVLRVSRRYFATFKGMAEAEVQHAEMLQRFATDVQREHEAVATELRRIGETNRQLAQIRFAWEKEGTEAFLNLMDRFMREVAVARKAKDDFRESRIELDAVETKLRSLQSPKSPDICALYLQQAQVSACRQKFENCWADAFTKLSDVDTKRDLDLLLSFISFVEAQKRHWQALVEVVADLESVANAALQQAYALRMNDDARREKRAADKALAAQQAENTKWTPLLSLLSNKDLGLIQAICSATETDETIEVIVKVLEQQSIIFPIISDQIQREVTKTDAVAILFRGNTIGTKIMMSYVRFSGRQYMISTLAPLLAEILELGDSIEVDPNKMRKGQDLAENLARYKRICKRCLEAICGSLSNAPRSFREVTRFLNGEVNKKFANSKFQGVAGMVFLRFFCPGISTPDAYGLLDAKQLQPENRRALILVSKVLQNTANNAMFSQKEPYMQDMNVFVEEHIPIVNKFFADFIDLDAKPSTVTQSTFDPNTSPDCQEIYRFIVAHLDAIGKNLVSTNHESLVPALAEALAQIWSYTPDAEAQLGSAFRRSAPSPPPSLLRSSQPGGTKPAISADRATLVSSQPAQRSPSPLPPSSLSSSASSIPNSNALSHTSPPRAPSPRPGQTTVFVKPTMPPSEARGLIRPLSSPRVAPRASTAAEPSDSQSPEQSATALSLASLLPSPAAPPSPPEPASTSPRGPSIATTSPLRQRGVQRTASPVPSSTTPPPIIVPHSHAPRQPSPSPRTMQLSPVRETK